MELAELQEKVDEFINEIGGYWDDYVILARLVEELGEVASVLQRLKGYRPIPKDLELDFESQLEFEIGDLLFVLISLANKREIDLEEVLIKVIEKYRQRDLPKWKKIPKWSYQDVTKPFRLFEIKHPDINVYHLQKRIKISEILKI